MLNNTNKAIASDLVEALLEVIASDDFDGQLAKFLGVNNLTPEVIATLKGLSVDDRDRLIRSGHSIMNITINRRNVTSLCSVIDDNKAQKKLISDLVRAGASQSMMFEYFGVSMDEMAKLRRELAITAQGGRPAGLSENEEQTVYALYKVEINRFKQSVEPYPQPRMCLRIHYETGISLPKIYNFIKSLSNAKQS